ncbi:DoxX family membrane protein [Candidatus Kaiserbacteria bacterium]|nr:MAG: DoxX family membrane protein [Candidatus Kaiserbacteria bacterium]
MLNLFPIQFLAPFAYLLLRVSVGFILIRLGIIHIRNRHALKDTLSSGIFPYGLFFAWYLGIVEIIIGTLFLVGFLTQLAAILSMVLSLKFIMMHKRFTHPLIPSRLTYVLLFFISLSLLITGAGLFAFDLPI